MWNIKVVNRDWIVECESNKYCVSELPYSFQPAEPSPVAPAARPVSKLAATAGTALKRSGSMFDELELWGVPAAAPEPNKRSVSLSSILVQLADFDLLTGLEPLIYKAH